MVGTFVPTIFHAMKALFRTERNALPGFAEQKLISYFTKGNSKYLKLTNYHAKILHIYLSFRLG